MRANRPAHSFGGMKRLLLRLCFLSLGWSAGLLRASSDEVRHVDDSAVVLASLPAWQEKTEARLAAFERGSGVKLLLRLQAQSPTAREDERPGAYMRTLAARLGTATTGVLVVYFADVDEWRVWIGDELTPRFVGRPGTAEEFTRSGAMHDAKEAWLETVFTASEAAWVAAKKAAPADQPPPPAQRVALQAGALVDGLVQKLNL